jgi:hypothetical protein
VQVDEAGCDEQTFGVDDIAPSTRGNVVLDGRDLVTGDADIGSALYASRWIEHCSTANHEVESLLLSECRSSKSAEKESTIHF